jgi:signal recognition particle receptor subunit beta
MSMINYASREINCKLVYYGSGLGGKTTNLEHVYSKVKPDTRGKLISLATETERTLFFDFLPVDLGTIRGFKTRFHLYTVPGQVYYNASRKLILKGVDGIVFVADSQIERMEANQESMQNLYDNMAEYGYDLTKMPFLIQYNKRDLPNAAPLKDLQAALNPGWEVTDPARQRLTPDPMHPGENLIEQLPTGEWIERAPYIEAVAITGDGVFDTLKAVSKLVLKSLA